MKITQNITLINQLDDKYIISQNAHDAGFKGRQDFNQARGKAALMKT